LDRDQSPFRSQKAEHAKAPIVSGDSRLLDSRDGDSSFNDSDEDIPLPSDSESIDEQSSPGKEHWKSTFICRRLAPSTPFKTGNQSILYSYDPGTVMIKLPG